MIELVVGKPSFGQVEQTDVKVEVASKRCDEGRLATTGRAVQQVTSPIRDATFRIPTVALEESLHIADDSFFFPLSKDYAS